MLAIVVERMQYSMQRCEYGLWSWPTPPTHIVSVSNDLTMDDLYDWIRESFILHELYRLQAYHKLWEEGKESTEECECCLDSSCERANRLEQHPAGPREVLLLKLQNAAVIYGRCLHLPSGSGIMLGHVDDSPSTSDGVLKVFRLLGQYACICDLLDLILDAFIV